MKLFTTKQIAELDKYTIELEPIKDIDLMERASLQITNWLLQHCSTEDKILFFAGPGNNGGDAMAVARQMANLDYQCELYLVDCGKDLSGSSEINWMRLEDQRKVSLKKLSELSKFPDVEGSTVLVDGLFGSGITRPLEGLPAAIVGQINQQSNTIIAIDMPSGLMGENNDKNRAGAIVRADFTLTFQMPKLCFLFAENAQYIGNLEILPIGLHPDGMQALKSPWNYLEEVCIADRLPVYGKFDHKGTHGHALLIAGSYGKMGAAVLASKACLRSGAGLLTSHVPLMGYSIVQTSVPEAIVSIDQHDTIFTEFPDLKSFSAIGIGPGLDTKPNSQRALRELLETAKIPLVIDADALNILAENKEWLSKLPEGTILTPHPGEFCRLVGDTKNSYEAIQKQVEFSKKYGCVVLLKGAHTSISTSAGELFFNSTGNPGMATAGSGDVLTGIILGLLAQEMSSEDAAIVGTYVHGLAGDIAAYSKSELSLVAGDIVDYLGQAFLKVLTVG